MSASTLKHGEWLLETERNKGAKPGKTGNKALPLLDDTAPTLKEIGGNRTLPPKTEPTPAPPIAVTGRDRNANGNIGGNVVLPPKLVTASNQLSEPTLGEMLLETERQKPGQYQQRSQPATVAPTLKEIGITKRDSADAQTTERAKGATAGGKKDAPRGHYTLPRDTQPTLKHGEMLLETERAKGDLKRGPVVTRSNHGAPTLKEIGITKRGQWLLRVKDKLPFSRQTVDNYIRLYENRDKLPTVSNLELTDAYRLLAGVYERRDQIPHAAVFQLTDAYRLLAGGKDKTAYRQQAIAVGFKSKGWTQERIGEALGVGQQRVAEWLTTNTESGNGCISELRDCRIKLKAHQKKEVLALYQAGQTQKP